MDLKIDEGKAIAQRFAAEADVVVESFRPGVMGRFGLSPDAADRLMGWLSRPPPIRQMALL